MPVNWDHVGNLLREVADRVVMPRYGRLAPGDAEFKAADEPVTVADREAEESITRGLLALTPGALIVGEEACAADPPLLDRMDDETVWLVDPIDGTRNFMSGEGPFAMMVALLRRGEPVGACILDPLSGRVITAEAGGGAWINGERLKVTDRREPLGNLQGIVSSAFRPAGAVQQVGNIIERVRKVSPTLRCAGFEYPQVAQGEQDFAIYWRTLAWDHAPGALLVRESGGTVTHLDGRPYHPAAPRPGLLVARTPAICDELLSLVA